MTNTSDRRSARRTQDARTPQSNGQSTLGLASGSTRIESARGEKRPLLQGSSVLPELQEAETKIRAWWKHPAFLVSMILSILALLAMAALMIIPLFLSDDVVVTSIEAEQNENALHLSWDGPDAQYAVFAVLGDGEVLDVSQAVRGTDVWFPNSLEFVDDETCFVVRDAELDAEVSLNADVLQEQGAQSICVADAE